MCTSIEQYATCGKHKVDYPRFVQCDKAKRGKDCQTLKTKKEITSKVCNHGKNGKSCIVM